MHPRSPFPTIPHMLITLFGVGLPIFSGLPSPSAFAQTAERAQGKRAVSLEAIDQRVMENERALLNAITAQSFSATTTTAAAAPAASVPVALAGKSKPVGETQKKEPVPVAAPTQSKPVNVSANTQKTLTGAAVESAGSLKKAPAPKENSSGGNAEILANSNANLRRELASSHARIDELERELDRTRSELALTETELTRISSLLDNKRRANLRQYDLPTVSRGSQQNLNAALPSEAPRARMAPPAEVKPPAANTDMPIATVSVDKADLRLGPGTNHSALMAVPRGSRLVVETRQGEWYRVFAPSGERAWIQSGMVLFGDGASVLNDGTASRVKGFNPSDEDEAFRRLQKITAGR